MRLAVTLAMQPDANRSRAFAMSNFVGQHRHADRLDRRDLRAHQRQDDVEVVDHQVEDDVDVEAALGERAEPVHLDEPRRRDQRQHRRDRRVVAFRLPDGQRRARSARPQRAARPPPSSERAIGFSTSTAMPRSRNGSAMSRWSSVGTATITASTCVEELAIVGQRRWCRSRPRSPRRAPGCVSTTATSRTPSIDAEDPRVMPAEMADADDGDSKRISVHSSSPLRASCRETAGRLIGDLATDDRDARLVGGRQDAIAVHDQRPARVDRQRRRAGALHRLDRRDADDRHVESHVLVRLRDLDDAHAAARELSGPAR